MGGLHGFMGWDGPILTDFGGYQVFSLAHMRKLDAGRRHLPLAHRRQPAALHPRVGDGDRGEAGRGHRHGLDECPDPLDRADNEQALARTHAWAVRCQAAHTRPDQALFGIVQGGIFPDLRAESARFLAGAGLPRLRRRRAGGGRDQGSR